MKKLLPSALLALLLAYSPLAFCENWKCASVGIDVKHCIDLDSIKDEGAYRKAHIKLFFPKGMVPKGMKTSPDNFSYMKLSTSFDCKNKVARWLSSDLYGKDDKVIEGESKENPSPLYESTQKESVSKFFDSLVCGK